MQGRKTACELHARSQCPSTFVGLESALTGHDSGKITLTEQQLGPSWYDGKMMIYTLWKKIGEVEENKPKYQRDRLGSQPLGSWAT